MSASLVELRQHGSEATCAEATTGTWDRTTHRRFSTPVRIESGLVLSPRPGRLRPTLAWAGDGRGCRSRGCHDPRAATLTRVGGERAANAPSREAEIGYGQARPGWKPQLAHIHCDIKRT